MTEVPLKEERWLDIKTSILTDWLEENNIVEDDWYFVSNGFKNPVIMFLHKGDALAFKLKFSDIVNSVDN